MKCPICMEGETRLGVCTVTLERDGNIIVVKDVPADICRVCDEEYVDEATTATVLQYAEKNILNGTELSVMKFVTA